LYHRFSMTPALLAVLSVAACTSASSDTTARSEVEQQGDPAEGVNRTVYGANSYIDRNALKPVAMAYKNNIPSGVRGGIHNVLDTLEQPVTAINDVLQAAPERALTTAGRFVVNATVGGLGIFDVATDWGLPGHHSDYGETFGVWGVPPGPFIMLPLLGPSNARDAVGTVIGFVADPLAVVAGASTAATAINAGKTATDVVATRSDRLGTLDPTLDKALDPYATLRSLSQQHRASQVSDGKTPDKFGALIHSGVPGGDVDESTDIEVRGAHPTQK
jgi:phospholipid-binding lipoprotein MlaA